MTKHTYEEAVAEMDKAFGRGADIAHQILRRNAEAKRIYDCAIAALMGLREADQSYPLEFDPIRGHIAAGKALHLTNLGRPPVSDDPFQTTTSLPDYSTYTDDALRLARLSLKGALNIAYGRLGRPGTDPAALDEMGRMNDAIRAEQRRRKQ
ncbi:hypothetical protein [Mesorhizobium sp.]|uniref:hypothetical protein n=1 Tax=Mesorhizobium sp. TaxID=1871066 RepID=UPI000FE7D28B|nr:hypothetical protein [Mesorhizobium sp.]RWF33757.1 MAG: hypothetical protein EOS45_02165 [Mesorhizobium sp.]